MKLRALDRTQRESITAVLEKQGLERRVNSTFPFNIKKFKEGILGWFGKEKIIHRKIAASELVKLPIAASCGASRR